TLEGRAYPHVDPSTRSRGIRRLGERKRRDLRPRDRPCRAPGLLHAPSASRTDRDARGASRPDLTTDLTKPPFVATQDNPQKRKAPHAGGFLLKRMMGLEPTTFCMASRRSSQLSYIRERRQYSRGLRAVEGLIHQAIGELVVLPAHRPIAH